MSDSARSNKDILFELENNQFSRGGSKLYCLTVQCVYVYPPLCVTLAKWVTTDASIEEEMQVQHFRFNSTIFLIYQQMFSPFVGVHHMSQGGEWKTPLSACLLKHWLDMDFTCFPGGLKDGKAWCCTKRCWSIPIYLIIESICNVLQPLVNHSFFPRLLCHPQIGWKVCVQHVSELVTQAV